MSERVGADRRRGPRPVQVRHVGPVERLEIGPEAAQLRITVEELLYRWMRTRVRDVTKPEALPADLDRATQDEGTPGDVTVLRTDLVEGPPLELPPHAAIDEDGAPVAQELIAEAEENVVAGTKRLRPGTVPPRVPRIDPPRTSLHRRAALRSFASLSATVLFPEPGNPPTTMRAGRELPWSRLLRFDLNPPAVAHESPKPPA